MRLYSVRTSPADAEVVADRCWQAGATGIWEDVRPDVTVLRVGVDEEAADAFENQLADLTPTDVTEAEAVTLATRTVEVGPPGATVTLTVPPTVFGDGAHPTTTACLAEVARLVTAGTRVLDVGCGSGALSVVAARLGGQVTAIDIDPLAARTTAANAEANGVAVDVSSTPVADVDGRFDVVLANISAGAVLELADALTARTVPGGTLVVSGILEHRWPEVRSAVGGELTHLESIDGWVTATVRAS